MTRQIVVDLVSDERDFVRGMDKSADSAERTAKALGMLEGKANGVDDAWKRAGEGIGDSESKFMGTADLLDGLSVTMGGVNTEAVDMFRGFADIADGAYKTLVPAITAGTAKIKGMSAAMIASPMGKFKLAAAAAAVAVTAVAVENGNLNVVIDKGKSILSDSVKGWDVMIGKLLGVVGAAASATVSIRELQDAGKTINGPDSLRPPGGGVSIGDLKNWNGSGSAGDWSSKKAAADAAQAGRDAIKAANDSIARVASSAAEAAGKSADKAAANAQKVLEQRFAKIKDVLGDALNEWRRKIEGAKGVRDAVKGLFEIDVNRDDPMGMAHGMKTQLERMKKFVEVIGRLRKMGFNEGLVRGLVDRGPAALEDATELSHISVKDTNRVAASVADLRGSFARDEAKRRTGIDPNKPGKVKVTLDVKGSDKQMVSLIKKWVREEGGGNVQVAFGK